jgi:hypothetical protein
VLVLTHNRPINAELARRLRLTAGGATDIEWRTFFGWAGSLATNWPEKILSAWAVERRVTELMSGGDWGRLTPRFVTDEIGYIRDLGVDSLLEREGAPRLDESARAELAADHTRMLYMGCTRAARRLVVFSHNWGT